MCHFKVENFNPLGLFDHAFAHEEGTDAEECIEYPPVGEHSIPHPPSGTIHIELGRLRIRVEGLVDSENLPGLDELTAQLGFFVKPGERLVWRTELPLIVLGHGKPYPRKARDGSDSQTNRMTEEQWAAWDRTWRELQEDLAKRSTQGEFRSFD